MISSYKILNVADAWRTDGPQTWSLDLSPQAYGKTHGGYAGSEGGADNIGFLRVDGTIHGRRVGSRALLAQPGILVAPGVYDGFSLRLVEQAARVEIEATAVVPR